MLTHSLIEGAYAELREALEANGLPVADIADSGRVFFRFEKNGVPVGYGGLEVYGPEALLRSVVILPEKRGIGFGRQVSEALLAEARNAGARRAFLLTETAKPFFEHLGFTAIPRDTAPPAIKATRQATTICSTASLLTRRLDAYQLRRFTAEALGTGLVSATVIGSGLMAAGLTDDRALLLLTNALPVAAIIAVLGWALGPVSGGQLNPVVTIAAMIDRERNPQEAIMYIAAQLLGGMVGAILAHLMFEGGALPRAEIVRSGAMLWLSEAVAAFGLVFAVSATSKVSKLMPPAAAGLFILAAYWFTASTSFANPAVTLARAFTSGFTGIRLADVPGFIAAQLAGALLAAGFCRWLFAPVAPPPVTE